MKTMLITFFDIKGIVQFELIPQGQNTGYIKLCVEKGLTLVQQSDYPPGQCSSSKAVSGTKIDYWYGTPTLSLTQL